MKDERLNNSPMLPLEVLVLKYFFDEPKSYLNTIVAKNFSIHPIFQAVNKLFVLSSEDRAVRM